ncbi:type VII secretion-associated serine protease mycosin [Streptomyces sp. IMTB 2501]|uniref:type VII secretion-associated serine protease mycosin n=1 Tax=Streptomyces sp. IMTB 2501 TaxID=1776340 RepID=UPI00096C2CBE|nr:type VII secretion-associated serine protease mycosin [Streptomyces sp. IMTB 2501]OLZ60741.1 type VII secretion-associated serine protease mycosin [Streptomyces sp. IMTB 2501]
MLVKWTRLGRRKAAAAAVLGLLLVGAAGQPAYAEGMRAQQWFLDAMKAEQMWRTSTGKSITVAVIDTGVDAGNADLKGRVLPGKDFAVGQAGDEHIDYDGHGTGMAGLIAGTGAADGGNGAFGLAPGAKILPVRMPKSTTAANEAASIEQFNQVLPKAIRYAADAGAQVINISMGAEEGSPEVTAAVKYALGKGALVFAGVGNSGDKGNPVEYPAATPGVVGVAAVGKDLRRTSWSEYGPQVDMSAPGADMVAACTSTTGFCKTDGTSEATAVASASAALIWSKHPDWTNNQVLRVMLNTIGAPTDGAKRNDSIGYGIVRPRVALQNPGDPGPANVYPLPGLKDVASKPTSPKASQTAGGAAPARNDNSAAAASSSDADNTLWIALGVGAVVLLGAAITIAAVVRRRRTTTAPLPTPFPAPGRSPYGAPGSTPPSDR